MDRCRWRCTWTDADGDAHGQMQMHMDRCACVCAHVHDADFRDQTVVPYPNCGSLPSLCVVNFRAGLSTPVLLLNLFIDLFILVLYLYRNLSLCYLTYGAERPDCT